MCPFLIFILALPRLPPALKEEEIRSQDAETSVNAICEWIGEITLNLNGCAAPSLDRATLSNQTAEHAITADEIFSRKCEIDTVAAERDSIPDQEQVDNFTSEAVRTGRYWDYYIIIQVGFVAGMEGSIE